jgi:hypothetical protein
MPDERSPKFMAVTPVKLGREAEFEAFVRDVIVPAARQVRPHIIDTWRLLRPAGQPSEDGAQAAHVFLFYGDSWDDYELENLFEAAYGEDTGRQRHQEFEDFLAGEQIGYEFDGEVAH